MVLALEVMYKILDPNGSGKTRTNNSSTLDSDGYPYSGAYKVKGQTWTRTSDELSLLLCYRNSSAVTPSKPSTFLLDKTGNRYVSSLYGAEFEYEGIRYRVDRAGDGQVRIDAIRKVSKRNRRGGK